MKIASFILHVIGMTISIFVIASLVRLFPKEVENFSFARPGSRLLVGIVLLTPILHAAIVGTVGYLYVRIHAGNKRTSRLGFTTLANLTFTKRGLIDYFESVRQEVGNNVN